MRQSYAKKIQDAFGQALSYPAEKEKVWTIAAELIGQLPAPVDEQEFMNAKAMLDSYGQEVGMMERVAEEAIRSGRYGWAEAFLRWDPRLLVETSLNKYLAWQLGSMAATIGREQARRTMDVAIEIFDSKQGLGLTSLRVMNTLTMLFRKTPGLEGELTPEQRQLLEKAVEQHNQEHEGVREFKRILLAGHVRLGLNREKPAPPRI